MTEPRGYNLSKKTFEGLKFRLHHRDEQILQNLQGLLENHYIDDLEIKKVHLDMWAELHLIDKNSPKRANELAEEIKDYKSEIAELIKERQKLKRKVDNLESKVVKKDREIKYLKAGRTPAEEKKLLKEHKIKQKMLAKESGFSISHISNYLNGKDIKKNHRVKIRRAVDRLLEEYENTGS